MSDGIGLAEKMLGLPGLVVLEVDDVPGEVVVRVESTRRRAAATKGPSVPALRRLVGQYSDIIVRCHGLWCL